MKNVPLMVFEPNVVPGVANRMVARWVKASAVHFEATARYLPHAVVTGVPVRREFFAVPQRTQDAPPTLLVFGGSQGAHAINTAVMQALPSLVQQVPSLHLIHQTGQNDLEEAQAAALAAGISAEVAAFIDDMPTAFARADLLICRSGASTVAEVAAAGKPAIFIPLPTAADDHQRRNAETLGNAGAARVLPQADLTPERLATEVISLFRDRAELIRMGATAKGFAHPDASAKIAAIAARLAGVPGSQDVA